MKMMQCKTLLLFFALLVFSKGFAVNYVDLAYAQIKPFAKEMKKKQQASLVGTGGGFFLQINWFSLTFVIEKEVSLEEARRICIDSVETCARMTNANKKIRPFLRNYPFDASNVDFSVMFYEKSKNTFVSKDFVAVLYCRDDEILYAYNDKSITKGNTLQRLHKESYADALRIVNSEKLP